MSRKIRGRELLEEVRNWSMDKARELTSHDDEYEFGAVNVGKTRVLLEVEGYISDLIEREDERGVLGWMDTVSLDDLILEDSEDLEITVDGSELMSWGRDEGKRYIYVRLRMDESDYRYNYIMKMKDDNRIESFDFDKMGSREFGVICICNESELMKMMREVNENVQLIETFDVTRMVKEMKERDGSYYDVWKKLVGWRCDEGKRYIYVRLRMDESDRDTVTMVGLDNDDVYRINIRRGEFELILETDRMYSVYRAMRDKCKKGIDIIDAYDVSEIVWKREGMGGSLREFWDEVRRKGGEVCWTKEGVLEAMLGGRDSITLEIRDIDINERRELGRREG